MTTLGINTHGLPPATADAIRDLVEDLIARHPRLTALQLAGSYWNQSSQLPGADIDIRRFGEVDRATGDDRVARPVALFEHRGQLVELAEWFYGDLTRPETLSLRDAVSFARAHILWDRASWLRDRTAAVAAYLADPEWRRCKFDEAFARCELRFSQLLSANRHLSSLRTPPSAVTDEGYFKHVFYTLIDEFSGLISVLDLRPPSLARKAMMEIADCLSIMQLPHITETIFEALGCADFGLKECHCWRAELESVYSLTASINEEGLRKRRYHIIGMTSMLERGHHRAAAFPLWRGLDECLTASTFLRPAWLALPTTAKATSTTPLPSTALERTQYRQLRHRIEEDLERLRIRFQFRNDADTATRIEQCIAALSELRSHSEYLYAHLGQRVSDWRSAA